MTKIKILNDITLIKAEEGKVFKRKHDGFIMGTEIYLGYDFSTDVRREDKPEYYEEIDVPEEYLEGYEPLYRGE